MREVERRTRTGDFAFSSGLGRGQVGYIASLAKLIYPHTQHDSPD
jgi:hypothetical protein